MQSHLHAPADLLAAADTAHEFATVLLNAAHRVERDKDARDTADDLLRASRALRDAANNLEPAIVEHGEAHAEHRRARTLAAALLRALATDAARQVHAETHAPSAFERTPEWQALLEARAAAHAAFERFEREHVLPSMRRTE